MVERQAYPLPGEVTVDSNAAPHVVYSSNLKDFPYQVKIDSLKYGQLLKEIGMPEEEISILKTTVQRSAVWKGKGTAGFYDIKDRSVTLNCDWFEERVEAYSKWIKLILHENPKIPKDLFQLLYTKKLPTYLEHCRNNGEAERAEKFANKIIFNNLEREFNGIVIHEGKHAVDQCDPNLSAHYARERKSQNAIVLSLFATYNWLLYNSPALILKDYNAGLGGFVLSLFFSLVVSGYIGCELENKSDVEYNANLAEKLYKNDPKRRDIISIKPR